MHRLREALTSGLTWSPRPLYPSAVALVVRVAEIAAADGAVPDGAAAMESSE